jgi:hypothetical protein
VRPHRGGARAQTAPHDLPPSGSPAAPAVALERPERPIPSKPLHSALAARAPAPGDRRFPHPTRPERRSGRRGACPGRRTWGGEGVRSTALPHPDPFTHVRTDDDLLLLASEPPRPRPRAHRAGSAGGGNGSARERSPAQTPGRTLPPPSPEHTGLPALRLFAGYEMFGDDTRAVIRTHDEARWGATVRTGPTTHRVAAARTDPAALWSLAGQEAAWAAAGAERGSGPRPA